MVKVRVIRGVSAAITGASGLVLLGGSEACTAPVTDADGNEATGSALTSPGTGTLSLDYAYGVTPGGLAFLATSSTDEFVRVGEKLNVTLPAYFIWSYTHPNEVAPDDLARAEQLTATITVFFNSRGGVIGQAKLGVTSWTGDQFYALRGATDAFVIPDRTDALTFDIAFGDSADATKTAHVSSEVTMPVYVFGGELPLKHAVFDNDGAALRTRVVEGGDAVRGANVVLTYTDWRANTVIDSYSLDRQIGTAEGYGRFGTYEMPIYGDLTCEVSYGHAFDGSWQAETPLPQIASHLVLAPRTAFETTLASPPSAQNLFAYFHVKAFLTVDYSRWGTVLTRRYKQGDKVLLRDRYDNLNGVPFKNYQLPLEASR